MLLFEGKFQLIEPGGEAVRLDSESRNGQP
jgi:hypothetical protein